MLHVTNNYILALMTMKRKLYIYGQEQIEIWKLKNWSIGISELWGTFLFCFSSINICLHPFGLLYQNTIDRVAYKQQRCIPLSSKDWEFQDQGAGFFWQRPTSLSIDDYPFTVSYGEKGFFYMGMNPNNEGSWPKHFPKVLHLNTITFGGRFQHMNFGGIPTFKL